MTAQTSDRVSSIAGKYAALTPRRLEALIAGGDADTVAQDIRAMAASCLRQDEHRGLRGLAKRLLGG